MRHNSISMLLSVSVATLGLVACLGDGPMTTPPVDDPPGGDNLAAGGPDNTFDHEMDTRDPFDILKQRQEDGPPEVSARLHSCQKLTVDSLGKLLTSRGVNLDATAAAGMPPTAGQLYKGGFNALGAPNYASRTGEAIENTTAGATKLFDIFIQAAPEIITAMPSLGACMMNGQAARMFDGNGACTTEGVSCLMATPASPAHVALCNQLVASASTPAIGQRVAVATILAATYTCQ